ncbi:hypothetical protein ABIA94_009361 [Bradyrhizobium sp. LA7.1]
MDDTILSAYGRPEIAWNTIANEFANELAPLPPHEVATAVLAFARKFWANADASWRLKLAEARHLMVKGGFAALAAPATAPCPTISPRAWPIASPAIAKRRCSSSPARMMPSTG